VEVQFYSFFNLGTRCRWVANATTRPLYPRNRLGTRCTGGWVGNRAGVDGCGKSRLHQDSILGPSSPLRVAIPAHRSPTVVNYNSHHTDTTCVNVSSVHCVSFNCEVPHSRHVFITLTIHTWHVFRKVFVTFSSTYLCRAPWLLIIPVVVTYSHHVESYGLRTVAMLLFNIQQKRSIYHINKI